MPTQVQTRTTTKRLRGAILAGFLWSFLSVAGETRLAADSLFDDLTIDVSTMEISKVELGGDDKFPHFFRNNLALIAGRGRATFGLVYQYATKTRETAAGAQEHGLMVAAGYDWYLRHNLRLEAVARVGVTGSNEYQPLYAEDTDVRANFVWFDADGFGLVKSKSLYPSAYGGTIVNRFGRVQAIGGAGVWWNGIGIYATAFHSFNGDNAIRGPEDARPINFANLENGGVSLSLSYQWRDLEFVAKRNFELRNGGNDFTFGIRVRRFFNQGGE